MRIHFRSVFALTFASAAVTARAQTPVAQPAALAAVLSHLSDEAEAIRDKLPGFTCLEVVSSKDLKGDGSVKLRVDLTADLHVERNADGKLREHFTTKTLNGQPVSQPRFNLPVYMEGGFRMAFDNLTSRAQSCYRFTLTGQRLEFEALPEKDQTVCHTPAGTRGFALLDDHGELTHIERRLPADYKQVKGERLAPFASVDIAPVKLNGQSYPLSSHVIGEMFVGNLKRFEAYYTGCRLFSSTATLLPSATVEPEATPSAAPK